MIKVGLISLGCDKNRVDSEVIISNILKDGKFEITNQIEQTQIIIVNTCSFLQASREESIKTIFELSNMAGNRNIVMCGCLPARYIDEMFDEFIEVSAFVGIYDYDNICDILIRVLNGERVKSVSSNTQKMEFNDRVLTTPSHYAYLKIADGCDNHCSYCLIPSIRGRYRSRTIASLVTEAELLVKRGVKELILVAQDTTNYGIDIYGKRTLSKLLNELGKINGLIWIRLLYCYADKIDSELINEIKTNDKIVKYLDIPMQHLSDKILKQMNRKSTYEQLITLIDKLHSEINEIVLRTTFIVGFPNETAADVNTIIDTVKTAKIQYIGVFAFSSEEGTAAARMPGQIDDNTKLERLNQLTAASNFSINLIYSKLLGKTIKCIIDSFSLINDVYNYLCRASFQAPAIDGNVFIKSKKLYQAGQIIDVRLVSFTNYNLEGEVYEFTK